MPPFFVFGLSSPELRQIIRMPEAETPDWTTQALKSGAPEADGKNATPISLTGTVWPKGAGAFRLILTESKIQILRKGGASRKAGGAWVGPSFT